MKWLTSLLGVAMFLEAACAPVNRQFGSGESPESLYKRVRECAETEVAALDDGQSDARSVALALSTRCHDVYLEWIRSLADQRLDNEKQKSMFLWRRGSAESRADCFLPFVLEFRARKNGQLES